MEVLCERCQTEYDFDDALVSERGTTVKCTNCGHQFRIYRPKTVSAAPERWVVHTVDGRDQIYTSLRDLQRAITRGQVHRNDTLTRDAHPGRPLSSIAELEPFFPEDQAEPQTVPRHPSQSARERRNTPRGLGAQVVLPSVHQLPQSDEDRDFDEPTIPRVSVGTDQSHPLPPAHQLLGDEPGFEPATQRRPNTGSEPAPADVQGPQSGEPRGHAPDRVVIRDSRGMMTPTPSDVRSSYGTSDDGMTDPRFLSTAPPRRSAAARWVVGLVVIGGLVVLALTVGRTYLASATNSTASAAAPDPRVAGLLQEGDRLLLDGDIDGAKANFDKASVLAERDPHVLRRLARLANVKSDVAWLKLRLLAPEQKDLLRITRMELDTRVKQSLDTSDRALKASRDDVDAIRVRVDALRLSGDLPDARSLVPKLAERTSEAPVAYVLAALEMCEGSPNWTTVIDRLRVATAGEQNLGRARAALVYALARSGQVDAAQLEYDGLSRAVRPTPLLVELKAFIERARSAAADGGVIAAPDADVLDPTKLPTAAQGFDASAGGESAPGSEIPAGSYQELLGRAHAARKSGNLDEAERLYKAVLAKQPGDTEALSGLGDIARARGDKSGSVSYYEEVAKQNPSYLPAMMGLADAKWDAGDRAGAVALYQQVIQSTGGHGPYADKARARIASASAAPANTPTSTTQPTDTAPAPTPTPTPTPTPSPSPTSTEPPAPPGVDTSDLPGWSP